MKMSESARSAVADSAATMLARMSIAPSALAPISEPEGAVPEPMAPPATSARLVAAM